MEFIKTNINPEDKRQVYRMTCGDSNKIDGIEKGTELPVDKYAVYMEGDKKVLTFTSGKLKFGTISQTFIKSFLEIVEIMGDDPFTIIVTGGESKNGRRYVNCELLCD